MVRIHPDRPAAKAAFEYRGRADESRSRKPRWQCKMGVKPSYILAGWEIRESEALNLNGNAIEICVH